MTAGVNGSRLVGMTGDGKVTVAGLGTCAGDLTSGRSFTVAFLWIKRSTAAASPSSLVHVFSGISMTVLAKRGLSSHSIAVPLNCDGGGESAGKMGLLSWCPKYCVKDSGSWLRALIETSFSLTFGIAAFGMVAAWQLRNAVAGATPSPPSFC